MAGQRKIITQAKTTIFIFFLLINIVSSEINWKLRSLPPAHYIFNIQNFSLLSDAKAESFHSAEFEVGGYKWKLSVYPGGNKKKNGDGYVSLYLVLSESNKLTFNQEVNVYFKLFVYDHIRGNYWIIQGIKREWGFDKLVSVTDFKNESNGYLTDDCCIFGAEILVVENANKGECLSMVKKPANNKYTWTIHRFSELNSLYSTDSEKFAIGDTKWGLRVYPKGGEEEEGKSLSIYLLLNDNASSEPGRKLYAEYLLRVRNQFEEKHREEEAHDEFESKNGWGYPDLNVSQ
ncbi:uncharacterized protein LOC130014955 [Mercurialis annua]|uniref:uncharacterized protein LOC130014953 n=1 Tax=Mercurialis annua TaxID=3986 RepID=UPI0024AF2658|nr:uncharacterized protein LOC130014953 [Mercurialis annua]XP_055960088.1 uncharacterized protein LOC130014955 [Mercurialis annua]